MRDLHDANSALSAELKPLRRVRGVKLVQLKVEFNESPLRRVRDVQRRLNYTLSVQFPLRRVRDVHS